MRSRRQLRKLTLAFVVTFAFAALFGGERRPLRTYSTVVIQPFTVHPDLTAAGMPPGYEDVVQKTLFARLLSERTFDRVEDWEGTAQSNQPGTLIASGEIADFAKGNRVARVAVGYGAGSAKIKIVLIFRDALSGAEVLRLERTGRYAGFGNLTGGSADKARSESARKVVDGLMKQIKAAR